MLKQLKIVNWEVKKALIGTPANAEHHIDEALKALMAILAAMPK